MSMCLGRGRENGGDIECMCGVWQVHLPVGNGTRAACYVHALSSPEAASQGALLCLLSLLAILCCKLV